MSTEVRVADRRGAGRQVGVERSHTTMRKHIMAGDGEEEEASAGRGASCELPATAMESSGSSVLMKDLISRQSRSQLQGFC